MCELSDVLINDFINLFSAPRADSGRIFNPRERNKNNMYRAMVPCFSHCCQENKFIP